MLSDFTVSVPEIGTFEAKHVPLVFLTSNDAREMTDALKRRCLHLWIDYPNVEMELEILRQEGARTSTIASLEEIVELVQRIRALGPEEDPVDLGDPGLGPRADGPERRRARGRAGGARP